MTNLLFKALRGAFATLAILMSSQTTNMAHSASYEASRPYSSTVEVVIGHGPFNNEQMRIIKETVEHVAAINIDKVTVNIEKNDSGSTAISSSWDGGVNLTISFAPEQFNRLTNEMIAFVVAHELAHWDPHILNSDVAPHELELACDFYALLALEEIHDYSFLRKAIEFFKEFNYPSSGSHPRSVERYNKLSAKISEWERNDRKYPGRVE